MEQPEAHAPVSITLEELHRDTDAIIETMNFTGQPVCITRQGRLIAIMEPCDETAAIARDIRAAIARGNLTLPDVSGRRGTPLEKALRDLGDEP